MVLQFVQVLPLKLVLFFLNPKMVYESFTLTLFFFFVISNKNVLRREFLFFTYFVYIWVLEYIILNIFTVKAFWNNMERLRFMSPWAWIGISRKNMIFPLTLMMVWHEAFTVNIFDSSKVDYMQTKNFTINKAILGNW